MDHLSPSVLLALELVRAVELTVCFAVAVLLARRYRAQPNPATGAALALFGMLVVVVLGGWYEPADPDAAWALVLGDLTLSALLSVPFLFVHLAHVLGGLGRPVHRASAVALAVVVAATVAAPRLPHDGEPSGRWLVPYLVLALGVWTVQCAVAAWGLWRAGRDQSAVIRSRMHTLAAGAVFVALTIIVAGVTVGSSPGWVAVLTSVLGLVAVLLFAVAFMPPPALRAVWRQADLNTLASAERGLMAALSRKDVGETIVPVLADVFGGTAALLDDERRAVRTAGLSPDELARLVAVLPADADVDGVVEVARGTLAARLERGWLVALAGRLSPVFGHEEAALLGRVATLVDLALQRVSLHERERASRLQAETANRELETLLYSVSHDLRSPLISVLGYLDVLRAENADALSGPSAHYLERITVNAVYMQSLISDLLELSRIGRVDAPAGRLDLQATAQEVLDGARLTSPEATLRIEGRLPVVRMNDVRARQLLTNLVDNALKHGGRPDLVVTVSAGRGPEGELVLEVSDDGRGVPAEYRERVLQVFERLDAPKSSPGTGMGLAICRRIAESLGGTLTVEGPPAGAVSGTTIRTVLPAALVVERHDPAKVEQNA